MPIETPHTRTVLPSTARPVMIALALALATASGGCGDTQVELKGGLFEMAGLSGDLTNKKTNNAKVPQRAGLVLPPENAKLPAPGSAPPTTASLGPDQGWPVDPEAVRSGKKDAERQAHADFCAKAREWARINNTEIVDDGPLGSCQESIFKSLSGRDPVRDKGGNGWWD